MLVEDGDRANLREPEARLEEAVGLAAAIDLSVVTSLIATVASPRPATYLGKGKVEELAPSSAPRRSTSR